MTTENETRPTESKTSPQTRPRMLQGHSAGTILTNRSKNITVITPFDKRRGEPARSMRKGTRWMHRTTLSLDERGWKRDFNTSAKTAFGGKDSLEPAERPAQCPTLHTSHFDIGWNQQQHFGTRYGSEFVERSTEHPNRLHYPSLANWSHNVTGQDMQKVLSRDNNQLDYWTSYGRVHSKLGLERGEGVPRPEQPKQKYDLLTGKSLGPMEARDQHLVSGNRVLHSARRDAQDYFVLG
ncbi:uncharacterized protein LOC119734876 [Patiria miniata]|uniref:Uncharacterized protein n=1 Tax=Patiria miniata TaxID=46514 RepID=A0A913ZB58_PATMI|nr:uncharacterized protein LOC119722147 [Patiria miniata]XP_038064412.1 uncharacterized protein LOC119734876 [Patiria miniata]